MNSCANLGGFQNDLVDLVSVQPLHASLVIIERDPGEKISSRAAAAAAHGTLAILHLLFTFTFTRFTSPGLIHLYGRNPPTQ